MGCNNTKAADAGDTLEFLSNVPLFKRLPKDIFPELAKCAGLVDFKPGKVIIRQGDEGNEFFVIKSGVATVSVDGRKVAELKSSDYFGENALLRDEPRTATITASQDLTAIKVTRAQFRKMGLHEKLEFAKRGAVGGGNAFVEVQPPSPKTEDERKLMLDALMKNKNIQTMITLDQAKANALVDIAWKEDIPTGKKVITQGDLSADYFYIVQSGSFEILVSEEDSKSAEKTTEAATGGTSLGKVTAGGSFGELALLYFAPRAATVQATEDSSVWIMDRNNFKSVLADFFDKVTQEYAKYLDNVKILSHLKIEEKQTVAKALVEMNFSKDERIFEQGEKGNEFYILVEGQVMVIKDGKAMARLTATPEKVSFFGETALLTDEPRGATVVVQSASARTLVLDRISFNMLVGDQSGQPQTTNKKFGQIQLKDLKKLGLLGCGGFGTVELVEHTTTQATYALKGLSKGYIVKAGMQKSVMSEKNVQIMCDSPFVVQLWETYNSDQSLYLLLELAIGGELYATYNKKNLWGQVPHAKFYIAGTVFSFEHLHSKKIIFRDLKPENLLLNEDGRVKLTDMGLAKVVPGTTYTTCGTPDYFAPELIASKGHTKAVDWWTLGILTFELLGGHPPFESQSPMQIYSKVNKGINKVQFPKACKGTVEDLIKTLCHANPSDRLPMRKGETKNIKEHPWYKGFSWEQMQNMGMPVPYKPVVKSKTDRANFSARKEDMPPQIMYKPDKTGWDKDFATST
eukprot:TRINITY_DN840_c0_g1_i1.p1 TRINITY_DN840_c0_g1~~TRINITY_DN840_c0_g1_i1.p1  ORF type:complete len:745 (-),score=280.84 TRINITY_DN840_c0_g1_i1:282-2516(-)